MCVNCADGPPFCSSSAQTRTPSGGKLASARAGNGPGSSSTYGTSFCGRPESGRLAAKKSGRGRGVFPTGNIAAVAGQPGGGRKESPGLSLIDGQPAYGSGGGEGSSSKRRPSRIASTCLSCSSRGRPPKATSIWNGRAAAREG